MKKLLDLTCAGCGIKFQRKADAYMQPDNVYHDKDCFQKHGNLKTTFNKYVPDSLKAK